MVVGSKPDESRESPAATTVRFFVWIYGRQAVALAVFSLLWIFASKSAQWLVIGFSYSTWLLVGLTIDIFQIMSFPMPDYDPETISPTEIGAVTGFQTFVGVFGAYYLTSLGINPPMPPTLFLNATLAAYLLLTFATLTGRFEDFCYLYHLLRVRVRGQRRGHRLGNRR